MAKALNTHYFLAQDAVLPNGQTLRDVPCSRVIWRRGVLRRVMKRVQRRMPDAFAVEVRQRQNETHDLTRN